MSGGGIIVSIILCYCVGKQPNWQHENTDFEYEKME